ncbi:formylmethanofuran dehydrogenase subunit C [Planctomicrobium sp. SH527]|uniref:formylmethanofuran dehydrogenase subunit C n=1 Tax=Planctomicrobium sp. SH527 TaxID=3448123 RepID=UPI003F5B2016
MSRLFQPTGPFTVPVDASPLIPELIAPLTLEQLKRSPIWYGNSQLSCGELFEVREHAADPNEVLFQGDLRRVNSIGANLAQGRIRVVGSVGARLGSGMSGGEITVSDDAGDWVGAGMSGGIIRIDGNVGNYAGAACIDARRGMSGGMILVQGTAGNSIGERMRSGVIAVQGVAGDGCGIGMIAGTLCLLGGAGVHLGARMKRGTILVGGDNGSSELLPPFAYSCSSHPVFLNLLFKELKQAGMTIPEAWWTANFDCFRGDGLELGLGELFFPSVR